MEAGKYKLGYRADIEGLRAIAVLLVVAAHAKASWFSGGFVGVDVFFVLSGYLITGLILQEIQNTGHLRFLNFYARRLRRLLPALLVMLTCTSLVAIVVLAPGEQGPQAMGAATAATWLSNIHFALAKLDYFGPGAADNLFLHTWSLGVEEQFYLVWPALMVWAVVVGGEKDSRIQRLKIAMLAIATASLIACLVLTFTAPQLAFYLMPLRAWQFALGALVWLHFNASRPGILANPPENPVSRISSWIGWAGLTLIVVAGAWFDANMAYPGWRASLPTAGAAIVLAVGARARAAGVSRMLSWAPLQALGRISYSWYLWHWPVLLLGAALTTLDGIARTGLVALSLLLAAASYRWVESPIRSQTRWTIRPGITMMIALALMLMANALCIVWFNATWNWTHSPDQRRYAKAHVDAPAIYAMGCDDWYHSDVVRICSFGPEDAAHTAVLMGDSIGAQWFPAVAKIYGRKGWRLLVLTKSSCPMVDEPFFYSRIGRDYAECTVWRKHALQRIAVLHPDIVILGSVQNSPFDQSQWIEGTVRVLQAIDKATGHIYLLRGTPHLGFDGPNCLASQRWLPWLHPERKQCRASISSQRDDDVYRWLTQARRRFDNVTTVDMNAVICPAGECEAERSGTIVFRDSQHLTASFVASLSGELERRLITRQETHRQ
jgi:peptidoglycan/LPS O-acetylase OafA/YrhL